MTSPANNTHQKHAGLTRPLAGEFGRNELAVLGTTCDNIKTLCYAIIQHLPHYKIAYADAEHTSGKAEQESVSGINSDAYAEYINKTSFTQINYKTQPNSFQRRTLLNDCDLILVNGNHFTAASQIVVIDDRKSLEKKLDKLTNMQLILLCDNATQIPDYLANHIPDINSIPQLSLADTEAINGFVKSWLQQRMPAINGLVLTGGKSTRMGRDKSEIHYHNKPQREHVYDLLSGLCNETFISCNYEQANALPQTMPIIADTFLNLGPLGGILSAFQRNPNTAWLVVACDLPYLHKQTIEYLIRHRNPSKMATAFLDPGGEFAEPLITIWEPRAYAVLLQFLAQGYSCPRKTLINSDIEILDAPDASDFQNINTTEEYEQAFQLFGSCEVKKR